LLIVPRRCHFLPFRWSQKRALCSNINWYYNGQKERNITLQLSAAERLAGNQSQLVCSPEEKLSCGKTDWIQLVR
jgi:hypothetical protein